MFRGKKYKESAKLIDRSVQYDPTEALDLVVKGASAKFDETVELHIKLGVDSRHADQQVRGAVVLPNGTGKTARVLVLLRMPRLRKLRQPVLTMLAAWSWLRRSPRRTGSSSTWS